MVEVGSMNGCSLSDIEIVISEKTAAIVYLFGPGIHQSGPSITEVKKLVEPLGIPIIVNAAAMLPPKSNLQKFISEGADLVCMSGGKVIQGPQGSGLLFGRSDLIDKALQLSSPNLSVGRAHKVSKETMIGLYTALKIYVDSDENKMLESMLFRLNLIERDLRLPESVEYNIKHDDYEYFIPTLVIELSPKWTGPSAAGLMKDLLSESPRLFVRHNEAKQRIEVNPFSLKLDDTNTVAKKLNDTLEKYQ